MEASTVSTELICIFFLIIIFFGLAFSIDPYEDYPRKVPEPWYITRTVTIDWEEEE